MSVFGFFMYYYLTHYFYLLLYSYFSKRFNY